MLATTIGTFTLYFLGSMMAWHILHLVAYRRKLGKNGVYSLAGALGFLLFVTLKLMAGSDATVLSLYWPITLGLAIVSLGLYDWIQFRWLSSMGE